MPFTDMPLAELRAYRPEVREPADFDAFWRATVEEARAAAVSAGGAPARAAASTPVTEIVVEDLTFPGFGAEPIKAWVARPRGREGERLPAVIEYNGYGGGRGIPGEHVSWALAGFVHVFMDTRGQGSGWGTGGETADPHGSDAAHSGFMTRGVLDPRRHYYRRLYTDAVRLIDVVRGFEEVHPGRVAVTGASQGGGVAIAAAALAEICGDGVAALLPDVAFLCDIGRGIEIALGGPYQEVSAYLAVHRDQEEQVRETMSYIDGANFARRVRCPALCSVALMDEVVPPSTTFAGYNLLGSGDVSVEVYPFNGHEGGEAFHWLKQVAFAKDRLGLTG